MSRVYFVPPDQCLWYPSSVKEYKDEEKREKIMLDPENGRRTTEMVKQVNSGMKIIKCTLHFNNVKI